MIRITILLSLFLSFWNFNKVSATHIVGGEVNYEMLNDTTYLISLKVYRDCFLGIPLFDNPAYVKVFNGNNDSITFFTISRPPWDSVEIELSNPCLAVPPDVCVESIDYRTTIILPKDSLGYQFVYQRCCRNGTIINSIGHDGRRIVGAGATFLAQTPPNQVLNSNPVYNDFPPIALCLGEKIDFDHSASDADGDSLVYKLCNPLHGGDTLTFNSNIGFRPYEFPPYPELIYIPPYSINNMLGGTDPLKIDPISGFLTGTPQREGQFVVGVCVEEYRDRLYLGETKRDFQFNVVECDPRVIGSFEPGGFVCNEVGNFEIQFFNTSSDESTSFFWDFGDGTTSSDENPFHVFPDSGLYTITLVTNPGSICSDTLFQDIYLKEKRIIANFFFPTSDCYSPNPVVEFQDLSTDFRGIASWEWNFGDGQKSNIQSPEHTYTQSGSYTVSLNVTSINGCTDFISKEIDVFVEEIDASFETSYNCNSPNLTVGFTNTTAVNLDIENIHWDFGDGNTSNTISNSIFHQYAVRDTYLVTMAIQFVNGCVDTVSNEVVVFPTPINVNFSFSNSCNNKEVVFVNNTISVDSVASWIWNFGDGTTSNEKNPTHIYSDFFQGNVSLTTTTLSGCQSTFTTFVRMKFLDVDFSYGSVDPCFPLGKPISFLVFGTSSTSVLDFQWDFGDSTNSTFLNPIKTYNTPGRYLVKFSLRNIDDCLVELEKEIIIPDSVNLELDFSYQRVSCGPNSNIISFFGDIKTQDSLKTVQWSFGDGATINNIENPTHQYTTTGDFQVFLLVTTALGCSKVINKSLTISSISPIAMEDSLLICIGDSIMLPLISDGDKQYVWSPSSTLDNSSIRNPTAKPTETTMYKVVVLNILEDGDTCFQTDSIKVKVKTEIGVDFTLSSDKNPVEPEEIFQLFVLPDQFNYSWEPSALLSNPIISNPTGSITEDTWFTVTLKDQLGCSAIDSILIEVLDVEDPCKTEEAFIPNAFTPDGNGFNDVLFVRNVEADEFLFVIYNRWGIKVFESRDANFGWDGRFNGVLQSTDVFGYYLRLVCNGEVTERKGNVTLVR